MKKTPFSDIHRALGGKMVEFAGYEMPVQYTGIFNEHRTVRERVGVFDVSHMGEFYVRGRDAEAFLQRNTINDVTKLTPGGAQYTALVNENGYLLDDLIVYKLDGEFMIVANASNIEKDFRAFSSRVSGDIKLEDASDAIALLSVQGPSSKTALQKLTDTELGAIPYYHFVKGKIGGIDSIISRTGYTGEFGFEIFFEARGDNPEEMWGTIFDAGKEFGILPIGLGARDTLRLEMGYCLYGNDIDETTNPIEAGLGWITKVDKGEFVGRDSILKAKESVTRKLVGFKMDETSIPRHGYEIHSGNGRIGNVTSGTFSPSLEVGIGMGYVETPYATENNEIFIDVRGKKAHAHVVKLPFVAKKN
ncbi:MAG: glycine cleavage system aminomethyltransferase GcvT [Bacteroidetes bacterium]|nr:glycine cleavage system aminomethyltransferase GcvT [Bacteroidota bacterium]